MFLDPYYIDPLVSLLDGDSLYNAIPVLVPGNEHLPLALRAPKSVELYLDAN